MYFISRITCNKNHCEDKHVRISETSAFKRCVNFGRGTSNINQLKYLTIHCEISVPTSDTLVTELIILSYTGEDRLTIYLKYIAHGYDRILAKS